MVADWMTLVAALLLIIASVQKEPGGRRSNDGGVSFLVFAEEENKNKDIRVVTMAIRRRRRKIDESSTHEGVDVDSWEQNNDREQRKGFFVFNRLQADMNSNIVTVGERKEGRSPQEAEEESSKKDDIGGSPLLQQSHHLNQREPKGEEQYDPYLGLARRDIDQRDL
eukprot:CAMPEP_0181100170 /NCGR_PEP_ID=MMETSP1071-20121207/13052_1 /TAXON_ID=35127 /ORGANISM="Thalassiosira sp., Strain NH16" /LENGTH=166 /DNA_ID=CAMNT_0023182885 /DNA_START=104 /DNA_END=601 /DNA_ORIENTATION=-